jgi:hypothetical protein
MDIPVRGTRLLLYVYRRCSIAVCEPAGFEEAKLDQNWIVSMKELHMIEKNNTCQLVDKPHDRNIHKSFVNKLFIYFSNVIHLIMIQ